MRGWRSLIFLRDCQYSLSAAINICGSCIDPHDMFKTLEFSFCEIIFVCKISTADFGQVRVCLLDSLDIQR